MGSGSQSLETVGRLGSESATDPREPALGLTGLNKTYRATRRSPERRALDGVSLAIPAGQWVALLGPNGSGKSTLVRIVSGADVPDTGSARIFGIDRTRGNPRAAAARLGVAFQHPGLDPMLTVRENLAGQAALFGLTGRGREERVADVAERLGIADRLRDRVSTLSGGLQRRVDLARALLHEPDLLILDEATSGLDYQARSAFLDAIRSLHAGGRGAGLQLTILMTTHLMDEAERAGRVVMMAAGRIVADAPPADLRSSVGGRLVRASPLPGIDAEQTRTLLSGAGLSVSDGDRGTLIGRAPADPSLAGAAVERAAAALLRLGAAFEVAPPTLGDAYLALTGTGLEAELPPEPVRSSKRRVRR